MTDYNYGDEGVVLSDDDSSKNHAHGLDGHSLTLSPIKDWPGTSANPNEIRANHDDMDDVADQLDKLADRIQSNTMTQLQTKGGTTNYGPDQWYAAKYLKDSMSQVTGLVSQYSTTLQSSLREAASSIRAAKSGYSGADNTNAGSANAQAKAM